MIISNLVPQAPPHVENWGENLGTRLDYIYIDHD